MASQPGVPVREVRLPQDRAAALEVVSHRLAQDVPGYTPHPGELDWWWYHRDPDEGACRTVLLGDDGGAPGLLHVEPAGPSVVLVADDEPHLARTVEELLPGPLDVEHVATRDTGREDRLRARGFAPAGRVMLEMHHVLAPGGSPERLVAAPPPGWRVTSMAEDLAAEERADAARLAFGTSMDPDEHRLRYRDFMASPGYVPAHDVVAVDGHGRVGGFCQWWADPSGVAQVEPMGTRPQLQRRGLGRSVMAACLHAARDEGMTVVRVLALEGYRAVDFYRACGFVVVDRLRDWRRAV